MRLGGVFRARPSSPLRSLRHQRPDPIALQMPADRRAALLSAITSRDFKYVLDMFKPSFKVGAAEKSEAGHGNRMQAVRRPNDAGNSDQTATWHPRLPRSPLAGRVLPDMQAKRADRKSHCHTTAGRDRRPIAARSQRIFAHVVARRARSVRRCRMGIVRYSRPLPGNCSAVSVDRAAKTVPLPQAGLAWPGTEETCPKCHGLCHVYYQHAGQPGVEVVGGKRVTCPVCAGTGSVRTPLSRADPAG